MIKKEKNKVIMKFKKDKKKDKGILTHTWYRQLSERSQLGMLLKLLTCISGCCHGCLVEDIFVFNLQFPCQTRAFLLTPSNANFWRENNSDR